VGNGITSGRVMMGIGVLRAVGVSCLTVMRDREDDDEDEGDEDEDEDIGSADENDDEDGVEGEGRVDSNSEF
jgi:hypothetical protein